MYKYILPLLLCLLLSGCAFLERDYRTLEPHSYSYREETDENALRVSTYQDLVNAILLLAEEHQETGRIHIYEEEKVSVWEMMRSARTEILQQTPAGAYALKYIAWKTSDQSNYCEVDLSLSYRRTAEEEDAIIDASSSNAVYDLIPFALEEQRQCLAVRFVHLEQTPEELVEGILDLQIARLRAELEAESPDSTKTEEEADNLPPDGEPDADALEGEDSSDTELDNRETADTESDNEETSDTESDSGETPDDPTPKPPVEEDPIPPELIPEIPWTVHLYPHNLNAGIVEIFFW